jgi:hypothetical protein
LFSLPAKGRAIEKQKDKRMFAMANSAHFTLVIPTVRNDFKVLAFEGSEAISTLYAKQQQHQPDQG